MTGPIDINKRDGKEDAQRRAEVNIAFVGFASPFFFDLPFERN
jgi:hypothetical protein